MASLNRLYDAPVHRHLRVPWASREWVPLLYLAGGIPMQLAALLIISPGIVVKPRWLVPAFLLIAVFLVVPRLTRIHRYRLRVTAGVVISPEPPLAGRLTAGGIAAAASSRATWHQLAYHLLAAPLLAGAAAVACAAWLGGIFYTLTYSFAWRLPTDSMLRRGTSLSAHGLALAPGVPLDAVLTIGGILLLFAAPWVTTAVRELDTRVTVALLGPGRAQRLEHRVEQLTQTRAGAIDAANDDRRRLERDLHDGTQQRLVSLAMNLGMARNQATTVDEARQAIIEAHGEAKAALAELRQLIRGLHPAVLGDRGLDAAMSGLAARMPIPVRVTAELPRRPTPAIEAVAYFVVSEALANIAKHAQASRAEVFVQRAGDGLRVIVSDDGIGGANPARGTGLVGLARRASAVDGTFEISSPPGGPTLLTVDLPCAG
jgi:signal transduction histidine kinase